MPYNHFQAKLSWLSLVFGILFSLSSAEDQRLALVISNSNYEDEIFPDLLNADSDGKVIASVLKLSGYEVTHLKDLKQAQISSHIDDFSRKIKAGDESLFFFAGHGFEAGIEPSILGVDATAKNGTLANGQVEVKTIVSAIAGQKPRVALFFFDSCREKFEGEKTKSPFIRRVVDQSTSGYPELLVSFSSEPGGFALEGSAMGLHNSPYTTNLANGIAAGRELGSLLKTVRQEVYRITGGRQRTWESSSVVDDYFISKAEFDFMVRDDGDVAAASNSSDSRVTKEPVPNDGKKRDWEVYQSQGIGYLSAANIKTFYNFDDLASKDGITVFRHPSVLVMQFEETTELYINNILYHLSIPTIRDGANLFISAPDLAHLLDPVVRPSYIRGGSKVKKVLLLIDKTRSTSSPSFQESLTVEMNLLEKETSLAYKFLITASDKERAEWLAENAEGDDVILIYYRLDVAGLAPNSLATFTISPQGLPPTGGRMSDAIQLPMRANQHNQHNIAIASAVHSHLLHFGKTRDEMTLVDLGIGRTLLPELRAVGCPAALVEMGRLDGNWKEKPALIFDCLRLGVSKYLKTQAR